MYKVEPFFIESSRHNVYCDICGELGGHWGTRAKEIGSNKMVDEFINADDRRFNPEVFGYKVDSLAVHEECLKRVSLKV